MDEHLYTKKDLNVNRINKYMNFHTPQKEVHEFIKNRSSPDYALCTFQLKKDE